MNTLFPLEPVVPRGFIYQPDFIDSAEEEDLIKEISKIKLHTFVFQGFEAKRKIASFGYDYSFDKRSLSEGKEIPSIFYPLMEKVAQETGRRKEDFAELLITEYPVGSVINWHRDAPPFDMIAGISLLSDCTFRLRPHEKTRRARGSVLSLNVQRRSLYIMAEESRSEWQHSILPVELVRYSITLRTLREVRVLNT